MSCIYFLLGYRLVEIVIGYFLFLVSLISCDIERLTSGLTLSFKAELAKKKYSKNLLDLCTFLKIMSGCGCDSCSYEFLLVDNAR